MDIGRVVQNFYNAAVLSLGLTLLPLAANAQSGMISSPTRAVVAEQQERRQKLEIDCCAICDLEQYGVPSDYSLALAALRDSKGNLPFLDKDKVKIGEDTFLDTYAGIYYSFQSGASVDEVEKFIAGNLPDGTPRYTGLQAARTLQLIHAGCMTAQQLSSFVDTEKPNGILVLPEEDTNSFYNDAAFKKYSALNGTYDLFVTVAKDKFDFYQALDMIPDIEMATVVGHGSATSLAFGKDRSYCTIDSHGKELYVDLSLTTRFDVGCFEFKNHLQNLAPEGVFLSWSCLNAQGGADADNLAHFEQDALGSSWKVIADEGILCVKDVHITSNYPLDAYFTEHVHPKEK